MKKNYIVELREEEADELMDDHWVGELVRCKDCKHGKINQCKEYTTCYLEYSCLYGNTRKSDWFCADGKRR